MYKFLNEESQEPLRDPILQQMTVARYDGDINEKTGFFHGQGKVVSTLGYTYTGAFVDGLMHGTGRIEWSDGTTYEGDFVCNELCGKGEYHWPNGDTYTGQVKGCVRNGEGRFYYHAAKETYEGGWRDGLRHGKGKLDYSPMSYYRGDWVNDRRSGKGTMVYEDGSKYTGDWKSDVREGYGTMVWKKNGVVVEEYKGEWTNGIQNGSGTSVYIRPPAAGSTEAALNTYTGDYKDGMRHGTGMFVYDDGSRYEGQWVMNMKHGEGKHTSSLGVINVGQFADGNPVTAFPDIKPESTVAVPLPLYIKDVLAETESNVTEAITAVQSVVSRNYGVLRKSFLYYSSLDRGIDVMNATPKLVGKPRTQGTMSLLQFLRMCSDTKLINRHMTVAAIDRLLLALKDRTASTQPGAFMAGDNEMKAQEKSDKQERANKRSSYQSHSRNASSTPSALPANIIEKLSVWERYRWEIHQCKGELTFREFVEAFVRLAAATYKDSVYGSVAHRLIIAIDDHLVAFGNGNNANPLFPLSREHTKFFSPHIQMLHCFYAFYCRFSSIGHAAATTGLGGPTDVTMTLRQFLLMLKELGVIDEEKVTMRKVIKLYPYDKYPAHSSQILKKQYVPPPGPPTPSTVGTQAITATPAHLSSPAMDRASILGESITTPLSQPQKTPDNLLNEAQEDAWRCRSQLTKKAKGYKNSNFNNTLAVEVEMIFHEFVEGIAKVANIRSTETTEGARVASFVKTYFVPHASRVGAS